MSESIGLVSQGLCDLLVTPSLVFTHGTYVRVEKFVVLLHFSNDAGCLLVFVGVFSVAVYLLDNILDSLLSKRLGLLHFKVGRNEVVDILHLRNSDDVV